MALGFDGNKAYTETGASTDEMGPQGGPGDPVFWMARVKMSNELACLPKEKRFTCIVAFKAFSGKAALADQNGRG
jgi:hypothetical protein